MTIAVTTPTGHVGSRVVRLLLQAGVRPRVLVRDPARLDPATRELVEVRQGDLTDAGFVRDATAGAEALFWLDTTPHDSDDQIGGSDRLGAIVADAVRVNGIGRTVFLSSVGAELRSGAGAIDGLARIEQHLDATGAHVLHLRGGYFFTNLLLDVDSLRAGVLRTAMPADAQVRDAAGGRAAPACRGRDRRDDRRAARRLRPGAGAHRGHHHPDHAR